VGGEFTIIGIFAYKYLKPAKPVILNERIGEYSKQGILIFCWNFFKYIGKNRGNWRNLLIKNIEIFNKGNKGPLRFFI